MKEWFDLPIDKQKTIIDQVSSRTGLPTFAIEKDWWVTQSLRAIFKLDISSKLVFKGGTSLSKSWNLIERFSEDIDLCIDRKILGFEGDLSKSQISKLRKASCSFTSDVLPEQLDAELHQLGLKGYKIEVQETKDSDKDPQIIRVHYPSITDPIPYLLPMVEIEIGARSLFEPNENREIRSLIGTQYSDSSFADPPILIPSVLPKRTFLEKIFLVHEEFQKEEHKIRTDRMTRHHYDLEKLMDTEHGHEALGDTMLYNLIVDHRSKFNLIRGIDYSLHAPKSIVITPPINIQKDWEQDYKVMRESMIYGNSLTFSLLMERIEDLQNRIRKL